MTIFSIIQLPDRSLVLLSFPCTPLLLSDDHRASEHCGCRAASGRQSVQVKRGPHSHTLRTQSKSAPSRSDFVWHMQADIQPGAGRAADHAWGHQGPEPLSLPRPTFPTRQPKFKRHGRKPCAPPLTSPAPARTSAHSTGQSQCASSAAERARQAAERSTCTAGASACAAHIRRGGPSGV